MAGKTEENEGEGSQKISSMNIPSDVATTVAEDKPSRKGPLCPLLACMLDRESIKNPSLGWTEKVSKISFCLVLENSEEHFVQT